MEGSADYENLKDWALRQIRKLELALELERVRGDKATLLCLDLRDAMNKLWVEIRYPQLSSMSKEDVDRLIAPLVDRVQTLGD